MAKRIRLQVVASKNGKNGTIDRQLPYFDLDCSTYGVLRFVIGDKQVGDSVKLSNHACQLVRDIVDPFRVIDNWNIVAFVVELE